jgi:putative phosphoribosyl transferase
VSRMSAPAAVRIPVAGTTLDGDLAVPDGASGLVVFAHGSGSGRHSPRNRAVAAGLGAAGFATLLLDLLTPYEEAVDDQTGALRFDIGFLARRLVDVTRDLAKNPRVGGLPLGFFGASTGGAAALVAAAERPDTVHAVVSRGGRPDLAGEGALRRVRAPTLLIVGGEDQKVLEFNRVALSLIGAPKSLKVIPGATHLFPEPGALGQVARLAADWFGVYLRDSRALGREVGTDEPTARA